MSSTPVTVTVDLDGVNLSAYVDGYVTIQQGRQDITTPFAPMTCTFTLADISGVPRPALGQVLSVFSTIDATVRTRFAGRITDVSYSGEVATVTCVSSTWWALNACGPAVSAFALAGAPVGQIRDVVYLLGAVNPQLVGKYPDVPPGFWYGNRAAQSFTSDAFTSKLSEIMQDAPLGLLYEQADGKLVYTDVVTRSNQAAAAFTGLTITGDMILKPVSASMSLQDVQNSVSVTYTTGTTTRSDATSVATYGARPSSVTTQLTDPADADAFGDYLLRAGAVSRYRGNSLTIPLAKSGLTVAQRNAAAALGPGQLVATPYPRPFSSATRMFVEGYTERLAKDDWAMTLYLTDPQIAGAFQTWDSLYAVATQWQNAGAPSTTWSQMLYTNL